MKKETRGRKSKKHESIKASFNDVLGAIAKSDYIDKKTLKKLNKRSGVTPVDKKTKNI